MEDEKKLCICPVCKNWRSEPKTKKESTCPFCGSDASAVDVDVDYNTYSAMSADEKREFKAQYLGTHSLPAATSHQDAHDGEKWINRLKAIGYIIMSIIILSGCVWGVPLLGSRLALTGVLIIILAIVIGTLSAAGIMVFAGMAKDIHVMRRIMEQPNENK